MKKEFKYIDQIEKYFAGELEGKELQNFEEQVEQDKELAEEISIFKDMMVAVDMVGDEELEASVKGVHEGLKHEGFFSKDDAKVVGFKSRQNLRRVLALAASFLIIVVAAFYFFLSGSDPAEKVFARHYQPEQSNISIILDDLERFGLADPEADRKESLTGALKYYENQEFLNSLEAFKEHLIAYPEDKIAKLYYGLSLLDQEESAMAVEELESLTRLIGFEHENTANWYLAMAYLQSGNKTETQKAIDILELLSDSASDYSVDARECLKVLK